MKLTYQQLFFCLPPVKFVKWFQLNEFIINQNLLCRTQGQTIQYKSPVLPQQQSQETSPVDFNSIFNKYNNMANVNLINPTIGQSNSRVADCLLSSSSSSTSSYSSAHQHNQQLFDFNNNQKATENLNFNSRSLGTFQAAGYNGFSEPASSHKLSKQSSKNREKDLNGSETNLSVKTAVIFPLIYLSVLNCVAVKIFMYFSKILRIIF